MARPRKSIPVYRLHKQSGQAIVTVRTADGKRRDITLGEYGSPESKAEYERIIADYRLGTGIAARTNGGGAQSYTINELLIQYVRHAEGYYRHPDGTPTRAADNVKDAVRPLRLLFGHTPAKEFGPLDLKTIQRVMVENGLSRKVVNQRIGRVRQFFKWAASEELIPATVHSALQTVRELRRGRTAAKETEPVKPPPAGHVERTLPFVRPAVGALIRLQLLTGARAGELVVMKAEDIDRSGDVWVYRPGSHKGSWREKPREIWVGPQAQQLLAPWLLKAGDGFVFSPAREEAERQAERAAKRKTPPYPSHMKRNAAKRVGAKRKRPPKERYTTTTYRRAIERACDRAFQPPDDLTPSELKAWRAKHRWSPHQLRHAAATELRKQFGIETARIILGHSKAVTTEIYAEIDRAKAMTVVQQVG